MARLTFDPVRCELWLDPLPTHAAPVQELCSFHVERLTVPRGWTVDDRRAGPEPVLHAAPPVVADGPVVVEPEPVAVEPEPEPQPEPVEAAPDLVEVAPASVEVAPEPVEAAAAEADVEGGVVEDDADEDGSEPVAEPAREPAPAARSGRRSRGGSPLLERAFAWTGPQQSILTQPRQDDDADDA